MTNYDLIDPREYQSASNREDSPLMIASQNEDFKFVEMFLLMRNNRITKEIYQPGIL